VRRDVVLDTGPLVAHLDPRDQWHERCAAAWPDLVERCVTTEAVLTEASHLLVRGGASPALPVEFVLAAGIPVVALDAGALRFAAVLMRRFARIPMDFADAGLVAVADALGVDRVFTTDRKGFRTYRGARGAGFEVVP
jgi:predicted nucleic acid-binding protein